MRAKIYDTDKVTELEKKLSKSPAKPPKFVEHDDALLRLKPHILTLLNEKNYDLREVTKLLKEEGIRTSVREIKKLVETETK